VLFNGTRSSKQKKIYAPTLVCCADRRKVLRNTSLISAERILMPVRTEESAMRCKLIPTCGVVWCGVHVCVCVCVCAHGFACGHACFWQGKCVYDCNALEQMRSHMY